jgi:hypothetical protein
MLIVSCLGETHSVCFTSVGEVWTWGSNSHGQLGVRLFHTENKLGGQSTSTPVKVKLVGNDFSNQSKDLRFDSISFQEDEELWTNELLEQSDLPLTPFKILQVCASRSCTGVILKRPRSRVSEVYQWGYGSHAPTKLQFFRPLCNHSLRTGGVWSETQAPADITQIAAGYNHFVGIDSSTGYVYTWGFGAVQLGHGTAETPTHLSVPLLLESMMPENGGTTLPILLLLSEFTMQVGVLSTSVLQEIALVSSQRREISSAGALLTTWALWDTGKANINQHQSPSRALKELSRWHVVWIILSS